MSATVEANHMEVFPFLRIKDPEGLGSAMFSYYGPNSKYIRFCGPCGLCYNYSALPLNYKSIHKYYINKGAWLHSNKTLLKQVVARLAHRP